MHCFDPPCSAHPVSRNNSVVVEYLDAPVASSSVIHDSEKQHSIIKKLKDTKIKCPHNKSFTKI